ncbi:Hint domain-containing protein [Tateyamaria omphalii]|uniref:Hedgehog/Intein (Hint) domain-containing protein n=1 Tax=Tateyamaria omphalii TaxID=299262 RepID=A0A1P8MQH9_9RHOB|nr:Hint domain-containing protein [Tateyamaria omphalii]APX10327.1 hypothetical protein BWR18_00375 [Tateyamaria omphalii]
MPDYDIYVLDKSDVTVVGGQLDGVDQGSGVHLQGLQLTLDSNGWQPISVRDNDDNFEDSDSSQRLDGAQDVNGTIYADNTVVEAEYSFVVTDGTSSWTLVAFNVNNSSPAYGTIEGLAFIGGPGGFPPVGVQLTVTSTQEGPSFAASDYATPICLASGTRVDTPDGPRPIEELEVGDLVTTASGIAMPIRWHGARAAVRRGAFASVVFAPGALGNTVPLETSQQHRIQLSGWKAELLFGAPDVLAAAVHLVNDHDIRLRSGGIVTYHHLLLDTHQLIRAEGVWTETLFPGPGALSSLPKTAQHELMTLFPELDTPDGANRYDQTVLPVLKAHEARSWIL